MEDFSWVNKKIFFVVWFVAECRSVKKIAENVHSFSNKQKKPANIWIVIDKILLKLIWLILIQF